MINCKITVMITKSRKIERDRCHVFVSTNSSRIVRYRRSTNDIRIQRLNRSTTTDIQLNILFLFVDFI